MGCLARNLAPYEHEITEWRIKIKTADMNSKTLRVTHKIKKVRMQPFKSDQKY